MGQIAAIHLALVINGQRRVIPPGAEIPEDVSEHDTQALIAAGALLDEETAAKNHAAKQAEEKAAKAEFQDARAAAKEAAESTKAPAAAKGKK